MDFGPRGRDQALVDVVHAGAGRPQQITARSLIVQLLRLVEQCLDRKIVARQVLRERREHVVDLVYRYRQRNDAMEFVLGNVDG